MTLNEISIVVFGVSVCSSFLTSFLAVNRGRETLNWWMYGGLFGPAALIVLFCLPNLKKLESQEHPLVDID